MVRHDFGHAAFSIVVCILFSTDLITLCIYSSRVYFGSPWRAKIVAIRRQKEPESGKTRVPAPRGKPTQLR